MSLKDNIRNLRKDNIRDREDMFISIRDEDGVIDVDDDYDIRLDFLHSLYYNIVNINLDYIKNPRLGAWQVKTAMKRASDAMKELPKDERTRFSKVSENANKFFINPRFLRHVTEFNGSEEHLKQMIMDKLLESLPLLYKENHESLHSQMDYTRLAQKVVLKKFEEIMEDLQLPKPESHSRPSLRPSSRPSSRPKSSERYKSTRRSEPYSRSARSSDRSLGGAPRFPLGICRTRRRRV